MIYDYNATSCYDGDGNPSIEDFREILDVPVSYKMGDIDKQVLKPIEKENEADY